MSDMNAQSESWPRPHRLTVHDYYRIRAPTGREYTQRDEVASGALPLPAGLGALELAGIF